MRNALFRTLGSVGIAACLAALLLSTLAATDLPRQTRVDQMHTFIGALVEADPLGDMYFVDSTNGADGNPGSDKLHPFLTLTRALAVAGENDTIILEPGGSETVTATLSVANASTRIVCPVLNPDSGFTISGAGTLNLMTVSAADCDVRGIKFVHTGATSNQAGILTTAAADRLHVENCVFDDSAISATWTGAGVEITDDCDDVEIVRSRFKDCHRGVLFATGAGKNQIDSRIIDCTFWVGQATAFGIHASPTGTVRGMEVAGCLFRELDGDGSSATDVWDGTDGTNATSGPILLGANADQYMITGCYADMSTAKITFAAAQAINAGAVGEIVGNATAAGGTAEWMIGSDDNDNSFASTNVAANANGSVLERIEYLQTVATTLGADSITSAVIANDAIGATEIANAAIDAATFAAGAIDASAIAADAITSAEIANDAIGATEIANAAIDAATFAAGAIDASAIADDSIDAAAIAADAITSAEIANDAIGATEIANAAIDAATFAAGAIDASAIAADAITSAEIANDAIGATEIANAAIDAATFAAGAIDASAIADDSIDAAAIAADAITSAEIANDAIGATEIANAAIDAATFAAGAIDASAIAADAITSAEIANDAIGATEIANAAIDAATFAAGAIDASAIAADAITSAEIANDAIGATEIANAAIDAATFAANAIDASALATDAVTEIVGAADDPNTATVNGKLGPATSMNGISIYEMLKIGAATGDTDIDISEAVYTGYVTLLTVTAPASGNAWVRIDLDVNKVTTGLDTVATAADTFDACLVGQVDGTNYRTLLTAAQITANGDGTLTDAESGWSFNVGPLQADESVIVKIMLSAERGDAEIPYRVTYQGMAPTVTPVAAL